MGARVSVFVWIIKSGGMHAIAKYYYMHSILAFHSGEFTLRVCVCIMIMLYMLDPSTKSHHHYAPNAMQCTMRCDAINEVNYLQEELSPACINQQAIKIILSCTFRGQYISLIYEQHVWNQYHLRMQSYIPMDFVLKKNETKKL